MALALAPRPMTPTSNLRTGADVKAETASDNTITPPKVDGAAAPAPAPVRPPSKPSQSLRLEPNPFEQSFSRSSTSLPKLVDSKTTAEQSPNLPALKSPRLSSSPTDGSKSLTTPKPILPPVAAISSPSTGFEWQTGDLSSLRSGPLSPAMLAGPRERPTPSGLTPFVTGEASFRSGLTPDVGRTGLTPLVGGPVSFPPPSPNTAAFLAMVTNGANGAQGLQGPEATITPNTLNALTGVLNGLSTTSGPGADNMQPNSNGNQMYQNDPNYGKYYQTTGADPRGPGQQVPAPAPGQPQVNGQNGYAPAAASATAHAATGLFLLSQAHHELTRREEMERLAKEQAAQSQDGSDNGNRARRMSTVSASTDTQSPVNSKRKSIENAQPQQNQTNGNGRNQNASRPSKRAKTSKNAKRQISIDDDELGMDMDMDGMDEEDHLDDEFDKVASGQSQPTEIVKRVETDEEKRRNFLERNRQAALKCRQRKKAWLQQLQQKVEYLTAENERLQASLGGAREEVQRLTAALVSHRDCPLHPPGGVPNHGAVPHHLAQHPGHPGAVMGQSMGHHHPSQYGPPVQQGQVQGMTPPQGPHQAISVAVPVGAQGRGGGFGY
ncbi:hypothetical protein CALVIDRAFT_540239 [Calocera viscosa TUFC12733]|uniref:BZIP domain-containing protein n=1 Tax=Calocera viscosa (strain TUFC12733) TaxID=1330018 RepID=A0A167J5B0_CALVF|nr:hypothetical protein CALVIDRAFT_540239 [Calocera viscosa TUFC12733]